MAFLASPVVHVVLAGKRMLVSAAAVAAALTS